MFGAPQRTMVAAVAGGLLAAPCWRLGVEMVRPAAFGDPAWSTAISVLGFLLGTACIAAAAWFGAAPESVSTQARSRWLSRWAGITAGSMAAGSSLVPAGAMWVVAESIDQAKNVGAIAEPLLTVLFDSLTICFGVPTLGMILGAAVGYGFGSLVSGPTWARRGTPTAEPDVHTRSAAVASVVSLAFLVPTTASVLASSAGLLSAMLGHLGTLPSALMVPAVAAVIAFAVLCIMVTVAPAMVLVRLLRERPWRDEPWSASTGILHGMLFSMPLTLVTVFIGLAAAFGCVATIPALTDGTPVVTDIAEHWDAFVPFGLYIVYAHALGMPASSFLLEGLLRVLTGSQRESTSSAAVAKARVENLSERPRPPKVAERL